MRFTAVTGLLLGAALVLTGCAATGDEVAAGSSASDSTSADLGFTAETVGGTAYSGQQLAGKPAVLWFWSPWCPTCRAQADRVQTISAEYAGKVNVVGVGGLSTAADIRDYAREVDGPTHLIDPDGAVWRHFGVTAQSTYVVLDADGAVVSEGYLDDDALSAQVAELVG